LKHGGHHTADRTTANDSEQDVRPDGQRLITEEKGATYDHHTAMLLRPGREVASAQ